MGELSSLDYICAENLLYGFEYNINLTQGIPAQTAYYLIIPSEDVTVEFSMTLMSPAANSSVVVDLLFGECKYS